MNEKIMNEKILILRNEVLYNVKGEVLDIKDFDTIPALVLYQGNSNAPEWGFGIYHTSKRGYEILKKFENFDVVERYQKYPFTIEAYFRDFLQGYRKINIFFRKDKIGREFDGILSHAGLFQQYNRGMTFSNNHSPANWEYSPFYVNNLHSKVISSGRILQYEGYGDNNTLFKISIRNYYNKENGENTKEAIFNLPQFEKINRGKYEIDLLISISFKLNDDKIEKLKGLLIKEFKEFFDYTEINFK